MQLDIREEIINSYKKLISDCEKAIEDKINVENNLIIIDEYKNILKQVELKQASYYHRVLKEMEKVSKRDFKKINMSDFRHQKV